MRFKIRKKKIRLGLRKIRFKIQPGKKTEVKVEKFKTGPRGGLYTSIKGKKRYASQMTELKGVDTYIPTRKRKEPRRKKK